jgi:superfamily II DNA helicase RecQ
MALTATAMKTTRKSICRVLGTRNSVAVAESPNKPNMYSVEPKSSTIEKTFASLVEEVWLQRVNVDKTIIFCRSYDSGLIFTNIASHDWGKGGLRNLLGFRIWPVFVL